MSLLYLLSIYIYIIPGKNSITTATQKMSLPIRRIFSLILGWFWPFYVVFTAFYRFYPHQDADFFPGMIYIYNIYQSSKILSLKNPQKWWIFQFLPQNGFPGKNQKSGFTTQLLYQAAKRLWKVCVEHHSFFRLLTPEKQEKPKFPRFGSRYGRA